ncbi:MAG: sigma-70 family RNA polymerase sigma factor [Phycisphaerae bacterium]|nr:sigma-70 family RNA polymerase sigma factor [Tepidisphaeraceae bacterium]
MAKFRIDTLQALARQLTFSPSETRLGQIAAAEDLLHTLAATKAYPLDYVIYRVTGYHPKDAEQLLFPGAALQHDLGQLIELVSDSLDLRSAELAEPVLAIEDVCTKFNVTSKTIQRWRRKGLPARRFIFPDGKRRVGFLLSSVERFVSIHENQVAQAGNFSQVSPAETDLIVARAKRLADGCRCCVREMTRRIARKLNRSPLTILHVIKKHDQESPGEAIFPAAPPDLTAQDRLSIVRKHEHGTDLRQIARRLCRPSSEVYRVLLEHRVERLKKRKIKFIDDSLYHQDDAEAAVEAIASSGELSGGKQSAEETRVPRDLPPYLQELYRTPLLTPARERALFLKFNYEKYLFVSARRRLDPELVRRRDLNELEGLLARATRTKNDIVRANLRLVVSVARKHLRPGLSLMELVSEGNITLMRAVEGFDFHKGHRFSTYATLALMKGFARAVPQMVAATRKNTGDVAALAAVPDRRVAPNAEALARRDEVSHLLSTLTDRERTVLAAQFGLESAAPDSDDLATRLGLTKQRVRQIQQAAITKLKAVAGVAN